MASGAKKVCEMKRRISSNRMVFSKSFSLKIVNKDSIVNNSCLYLDSDRMQPMSGT